MSFRLRLLATSLLTLVVGLGALLVAGNVLLERRVDSEATSLLRARAQAQVAALTVTPTRIIVRDTPNDTVLDRQSWVLDGGRVIERPAGVAGRSRPRGGGARTRGAGRTSIGGPDPDAPACPAGVGAEIQPPPRCGCRGAFGAAARATGAGGLRRVAGGGGADRAGGLVRDPRRSSMARCARSRR